MDKKPKMHDQIRYMLRGEPYTTKGFSGEESSYFSKCVEAWNVLGTRTCLLATEGAAGLLVVYRTLKQYERRASELEEIKRTLSCLPRGMSGQPAHPYWKAYCQSVLSIHEGMKTKRIYIDQEAYSVLSDESLTIGSLPDRIRFGVQKEAAVKDCLKFAQWLGSDFGRMMHDSIAECLRQKDMRCVRALELRVAGNTLNKVGKALNLSRERARQLEISAIRLFVWRYQRSQCDIVLTLSAVRGGDLILRESEIRKYLSEKDADIFWYLASGGKLDCQAYRYIDDIAAMALVGEDTGIDVFEVLKDLPDSILAEDLDRILTEKSGGDIPTKELLYQEVKNYYRVQGQCFHRGRLTTGDICEYILKGWFPEGYKIADAASERKFRLHMKEIFGEVKLFPSRRSIDAKMPEVGMLIDRGKYIHPSRVHIEQETIDRINAYIRDSSRTVLSFEEIFDVMLDELSETEITNKYFLQGALNQYGCSYTVKRDYVTKEDSRNMAFEVSRYIKERGVVHKSALLSEFSFRNGRLKQVLGRCPEIIAFSDGYFMHSCELVAGDEDVKAIRAYIAGACKDAPIPAWELLEDFSLKFRDFITENDIRHYSKLYGILEYLFDDAFCFSEPYILRKTKGGMTGR